MMEFFNLLLVLGVTVAVACSLCVLYATGLRLWTKSLRQILPTELLIDEAASDTAAYPHKPSVNDDASHMMERIGAVLCFGACILIVIYALWLMIPLFH